MSSQIATITAAVAAMSVSYDGTAYTASDMNAVKDWLEAAELPRRMLLPFPLIGDTPQGDDASLGAVEVRDGHIAGTGTKSEELWRITDVLFIALAGLERSLAQFGGAATAYGGAYKQALLTTIAPKYTIVRSRAVLAVASYPKGSKRYYVIVQCTMDIKESLS